MRNAQCLNAKNHPPVAGFLAIGNLRLIVGDGGTGIGWIPYCTVPTGNTSNSCFNRSFLRKAWSAEPLGGKLWLKLWWQVRFRFCLGVDRGNVSGETNYQTHLGLHHKKKSTPHDQPVHGLCSKRTSALQRGYPTVILWIGFYPRWLGSPCWTAHQPNQTSVSRHYDHPSSLLSSLQRLYQEKTNGVILPIRVDLSTSPGHLITAPQGHSPVLSHLQGLF